MDIQGPPKTVQRRFLVIMKLSKHKNGHHGSREIKVLVVHVQTPTFNINTARGGGDPEPLAADEREANLERR